MMKMTVCIEKGGVTEYTITVSAIVGNAKMKGVTTKVIMSMSMIMNTMMMMILMITMMMTMMTMSSGISNDDYDDVSRHICLPFRHKTSHFTFWTQCLITGRHIMMMIMMAMTMMMIMTMVMMKMMMMMMMMILVILMVMVTVDS